MNFLCLTAIGILTATTIASQPVWADPLIGGCKFDQATLNFAGTPEEQTASLLGKVKHHGRGSMPQPVPSWLLQRIGKPIVLTTEQVQAYIDRKQISSVGARSRMLSKSLGAIIDLVKICRTIRV